MPKMTVPNAEAASVQKPRGVLGTEREPVRLRVVTEPMVIAMVDLLRQRVRDESTAMAEDAVGWAVWQHSQVFIEAKPHAVLDPGNGQPWLLRPAFGW